MSIHDPEPVRWIVLLKNKLVLVGIGAVVLIAATATVAMNRAPQPPKVEAPAQPSAPAKQEVPRSHSPPLLNMEVEPFKLVPTYPGVNPISSAHLRISL